MSMRKKNFAKGMALCLTLALVLGNAPGLSGSVRESKAADTAGTTESAADPSTEPSGSPSSEPSVGPTPTPSSVASGSAADVDLSLYKPTAPQSVTARGGSKRVRLTWSKVSGADGYYIYARPTGTAAYTKAATVKDGSTVTYDKTSLLQNTTYYFQVSAYRIVNGTEVEGSLSTVVSAKTAAVSATSKAAKKYNTKALFTKSPAYKKYTAMKNRMNYSKGFAIPGMKNTNVGGFACKTMMPQAMCYAGNYLLISAYDTKGIDYSVIYVVSKAAKSYITTIILPSKAKVGGMAYDGTNIWISKGTSVGCFPYSFVNEAVNSGSAYKKLAAYTSVCKVKTSASYMGYYDGTLWVGPYSASSTKMYGYTIGNKTTVPSLTQRYSMAVPSRSRGITFDADGTLILSRSYRTKLTQSGYISQIRTYMPSYSNVSATGKILKNTALSITKMPPKVEGMAVYGTYTYTLFSSCQCSTCKYPVDRVIALKTSKLIG